jgi:hypothetical protein
MIWIEGYWRRRREHETGRERDTAGAGLITRFGKPAAWLGCAGLREKEQKTCRQRRLWLQERGKPAGLVATTRLKLGLGVGGGDL